MNDHISGIGGVIDTIDDVGFYLRSIVLMSSGIQTDGDARDAGAFQIVALHALDALEQVRLRLQPDRPAPFK